MLRSIHLVERVRRLFGGAPCRLQVAALPWRKTKGGVEVMLITSRDTRPLGAAEGLARIRRAAVRCRGARGRRGSGSQGRGLAARSRPLFLFQSALSSGDSVRCEVLVYPLEVDRVADKWKEKRQRERRWVAAQQAAEMVAEDDLGRLILHSPPIRAASRPEIGFCRLYRRVPTAGQARPTALGCGILSTPKCGRDPLAPA